ncbi:hypothetical protein H4582DRAFT_2102974 [Lactarius indigo]|nr:hypothetical protein H4582DRAFT_2102974 [Lactarius indigo]
MLRRLSRRGDLERADQLPRGKRRGQRLLEDVGPVVRILLRRESNEQFIDGPSRPEARSERRDFDDGANALWSLYNKEAQTHDEAVLQGISADMNGVPTFAGLFAAVLTSFLVDSLKNLQPDPAQQSVYYQQQSVAMLAQISQQIASIAPQVSVPSTPPPPYPVFHPSNSDLAVNTVWVIGLIHSLGAALLAIFVQLWVRSYMGVFERSAAAVFAPTFGDKLTPSQERGLMGESDGRKHRDARAIQWLINRTAANAEAEPLVLAIPGSFNTEWGQDVWKQVSSQARDTSELPTGPPSGPQVSLSPHSPQPLEVATTDTMSRSVRYLFETCNNHSYFQNEEARRRRMRACVEATASLVCCIGYRLNSFGDVSKLVSEIGHIEKINQSLTTTSDTSFIIRWTCLSLVDIQQTLGSNQLKVLAGSAVNGLARFQSEHGQPDDAGREGAQRVDECLKTAWERVEDLRRAFEPWAQKRTREQVEQVEQILLTHGQQISDLERIKSEADGLAVVDREISVYQDAMDDATHRVMRQLPGVSFYEPHRSESLLIRDTFNTPVTASPAVTPQLILPGQQLQALARLGLRLREVLDGQIAEGYEEVLESLKTVDKVPVALRRPNGLMKRQLWRLQDVRDGGGLGFTIELFFLSLRRLLSISSLDEQSSVLYTGTFKVITSHWGRAGNRSGRTSITTILLDTVGKIVQGYTGRDEHIRDTVREIESAKPDKDIRDGVREIEDCDLIRMDRRDLRRKALKVFSRFRSNP